MTGVDQLVPDQRGADEAGGSTRVVGQDRWMRMGSEAHERRVLRGPTPGEALSSCQSSAVRGSEAPTRAAVSRSQMWAASWVWTGCHHSASLRGTAS